MTTPTKPWYLGWDWATCSGSCPLATRGGTTEECAVLRTQALREQHQRQVGQEAAQQKQPQQAVAQQHDVTPAPQKPALEQAEAVTPVVELPASRPERKQSRGIGM